MLINLAKWRKDCIAKRAMEWAESNKHNIVWWDQDILNVILEGQWSELHPKFNYIHECMNNKFKKSPFKPLIIHFPDSLKPWHYLCKNPYKKLYWRYLNKTPYKDYREPDRDLKNMLKKALLYYETSWATFSIRIKTAIKNALKLFFTLFFRNI